ncbi:MAG TPA: AprI/Inh family metalloprotease inhibitor, partial [Beijerinckiaceae bacterium]|nr:AprI/Inh family metalloprotease inhibitor [Beijerinckiaceae bacterium]
MRIGLTFTLCSALALGACQSSRFGDGPGPLASARPGYNAPAPGPVVEPGLAAPSGAVTSEPLPPATAQLPQMASIAPSRSSVVGSWNAREASGSCRVQLSSAPALDLYRASASGCANRDLARVSAWDFRDGEVYLYQPGGAVAARLRPAAGSLDGVL